MLQGSLWDKIILFAIPLALTGVLQQLLNSADVVTLGKLVGKNAMAAVGNNTSMVGLIVSLLMGLSLGANVVIAQNIGAKKIDKAHAAVSTAFLLAIAAGIFFCIIGEALVAPIFYFLDVPTIVVDMAESYLRIFLLGLPAMSLYNFEAAIFRSKGDTRTPLIALIFATVVNITLNLIFVLYFDWGINGVAAATVIANIVSAIVLFRSLIHAEGIIKLDFNAMHLDKAQLSEIIRIGLPAGIQGMVFSLSNLLIQAAINALGADAMAASAAAFTIEINVFCIVNSFGQAATTFVGQNYGAGNLRRCKRATWVAMGLSTFFTQSFCFAVLFFAEEILSVFNSDPEVVRLGVIRLWYIVAPDFINVALEGFSGAMRGYGISLTPAMITLVCVCGVRITWVFTVFANIPTYEALMAVYPISWIITTVLLIAAYFYHIKRLKPAHSKK
ncbi:MAG: MATE family efflux transporter [Selenomonadaceae bacterium]|nr:MATE family efflux transporter [Selenomonadaceae bacterium]